MKKVAPMKMGIHIKCHSIEESLKFYLALGFEPVFVYGSENFRKKFTCTTVPENYCGVSLKIGDAVLEIADGHVAVNPSVFRLKMESSKISAFFDIESVDDFVSTCVENSIPIIVEPKVFSWGTKEVVVKDPDGFVLVFREFLKK